MPKRLNLGSGRTVCRHCKTRKSAVHTGAFEDGAMEFANHLVRAHPDRFSSLAENTRERLLQRHEGKP